MKMKMKMKMRRVRAEVAEDDGWVTLHMHLTQLIKKKQRKSQFTLCMTGQSYCHLYPRQYSDSIHLFY